MMTNARMTKWWSGKEKEGKAKVKGHQADEKGTMYASKGEKPSAKDNGKEQRANEEGTLATQRQNRKGNHSTGHTMLSFPPPRFSCSSTNSNPQLQSNNHHLSSGPPSPAVTWPLPRPPRSNIARNRNGEDNSWHDSPEENAAWDARGGMHGQPRDREAHKAFWAWVGNPNGRKKYLKDTGVDSDEDEVAYKPDGYGYYSGGKRVEYDKNGKRIPNLPKS
ncbi:hypothetical protein B0J14DRAFT_703526 [Halenospora varia]|nr:hypothetical protein B0J14DRAFT_703526 [Halenospora varia]